MSEDDLAGHLEHYLGPIGKGRKCGQYFVLAYKNPISGSNAYTTLGLGRIDFPSPTSGKTIRHEFLMLLPPYVKARDATALLQRVADRVIRERTPLLRGEVVGGSHGPILPRTEMVGLYVAEPVYLPEEFATYQDGHGAVVIAWLIPIMQSEVEEIDRKGWSSFERLLNEKSPDLTDLKRPSVV